MSAFWITYLDMVEVLLGLLRSNREGDWNLYLASIRKMIPWCFALGKMNYSRYSSIHYAQMTPLQEIDAQVFTHFSNGGFSVQLGNRSPFSKLPVDQVIEETVNKDTQTAGGTKGFSLRSSKVDRYYLTAEYRTVALKQIQQLLNSPFAETFDHPDLHQSRIFLYSHKET